MPAASPRRFLWSCGLLSTPNKMPDLSDHDEEQDPQEGHINLDPAVPDSSYIGLDPIESLYESMDISSDVVSEDQRLTFSVDMSLDQFQASMYDSVTVSCTSPRSDDLKELVECIDIPVDGESTREDKKNTVLDHSDDSSFSANSSRPDHAVMTALSPDIVSSEQQLVPDFAITTLDLAESFVDLSHPNLSVMGSVRSDWDSSSTAAVFESPASQESSLSESFVDLRSMDVSELSVLTESTQSLLTVASQPSRGFHDSAPTSSSTDDKVSADSPKMVPGEKTHVTPMLGDSTYECMVPGEWTDLVGNGKLRSRVLQPSPFPGSQPEKGNEVCISYKAFLYDGTLVDQSDNLTFIAGDSEVIPAIDVAVLTMEREEEIELLVASSFGYGDAGCMSSQPQVVPPNTDLRVIVRLLSVRHLDLETLSSKEIMAICERKRTFGRNWYNSQNYSMAANCYCRTYDVLIMADLEDAKETIVSVLGNLALCQYKTKAFKLALDSTERALKLDPNNVKVLYRQAKSLEGLHEYAAAIKVLSAVLEIEPNSTATRELTLMKEKARQSVASEKAMYQKMLQSSPPKDEPRTSEHRPAMDTRPWWCKVPRWVLGAISVAGVSLVLHAVLLFRRRT